MGLQFPYMGRADIAMGTMRFAAGIDLGGTSVKYALIDEEGVFHFDGTLPSRADVSAESVIGQLSAAVDRIKDFVSGKGIELCGIGLGTPGIVDAAGRVVLGGAENIAGWENIDLADRMEGLTGLDVVVGNDANFMGLGETVYGAGRGADDVVFITVGTGIGGAVIIGGRLFSGYAGRGTELGHVPLIANGEKCACGSTGCLEHYASASALVRRFCEKVRDKGLAMSRSGSHGYNLDAVDGRYIVDLFKKGDPIAVMALEEHCEFLGHGIGGFINIFSPQRVVIGGGLSEAGDFYIDMVRDSAMRHSIPDCAVNTEITAASLGNRAGCLGAASQVFMKTGLK